MRDVRGHPVSATHEQANAVKERVVAFYKDRGFQVYGHGVTKLRDGFAVKVYIISTSVGDIEQPDETVRGDVPVVVARSTRGAVAT
jgi:hypothetical protein